MSLQLLDEKSSSTPTTHKKQVIVAILTFISLAILFSSNSYIAPLFTPSSPVESTIRLCPSGKTLRPSSFYKDNSSVEYIIHDPEFRKESIKKLSGAVKIPTITFDYYQDPFVNPEQWNNFTHFHWFLESQFPLVYQSLKVSKPNIYNLVFEWEGTDSSLKPLLLTAHQDVVPVEEETISKWEHDPFEGYSDGETLWGRGSSDCKTMLIGELQAIERLIKDGFTPKRTVILAFGFDEEIGGQFGAAHIAKQLTETYGDDSLFALVDEGGSAISLFDDVAVSLPSIGEKGALSLQITLTTPGGHSSVPPDHTNIGIVAQLINDIEDTPFESVLTPINPTLNFLQCVAKYTNEFDEGLKNNVFKAAYDKAANSKVIEYLSSIRGYKYFVRTTQAVDIIDGGVKSNALPEYTNLVINHRISVESSIEETIDKIIGNLETIANKFDLGIYHDQEEILPATKNGHFNVSGSGLSPSPVSPLNNTSWDVFSGSIKHIIEDYIYPNLSKPAVVAGNLGTGNTDTSKYWNLTENIYRYRLSTLNGILEGGTHSVNEHTTIDNHLSLIAFTYEYIKNVDEAKDE
ncbi:hypothetical protein WICANDRAFT_78525 [Wickerhamomyces anomalus NRRL Y-366-8]|uniref:Peptidase M20 dimerisation domain-containing protein n=1 Tax=Wickerhamomyces anomalus (strain ATCC 58044 / CBS 1984 / NCYC 433 / NRRL Y-366-8) TaxID=683960 RepID=A0A1E3P3W4_WICAA|nr:uncharacterized protein WICANDRAFT_78525 [Wickerhamomyces anomalus NRRL Y-366-8]ODQ59894.1 hypothetical protein WICANDRAFT_78525 [Wickerhamomyces anomalus NRRL Y-366-8]